MFRRFNLCLKIIFSVYKYEKKRFYKLLILPINYSKVFNKILILVLFGYWHFFWFFCGLGILILMTYVAYSLLTPVVTIIVFFTSIISLKVLLKGIMQKKLQKIHDIIPTDSKL
ncbi:hypothetical protein BI308_18345 [Roseofilum reptotaenium AO1-A]|uniref:Uncharacterized protein n=1 Tax=Roseofilum reptotaenium AO1-A TaxID=1925591 RepID=A0A1L9QN93_9CYAN|nr:hypothetical protein BI308_18345 [Roseofilum reptotaenium AO1-A]